MTAVRSEETVSDTELFAWFDGLGFPAFTAPYVRVATGRCFERGNEPLQNSYFPALLLEDAGEKFR